MANPYIQKYPHSLRNGWAAQLQLGHGDLGHIRNKHTGKHLAIPLNIQSSIHGPQELSLNRTED